MKVKSKKVYVLMLAKNFLASHPKAGQPTRFNNLIRVGIKIHTLRNNYDFWKKRVGNINAGKAVLSIREWEGKPYNSKQTVLYILEKVGIQKLEITPIGLFIDSAESDLGLKDFAENDGLLIADFFAWFKKSPAKELAIIHFTEKRYK